MEDSKALDKNLVQIWRTQNLLNYFLADSDKRVKRDKPSKLSVLFTGLSAYLPEPINLFLKGESGIGKTYNVVEILRYFPKEDVWLLGGLSPKALIHEHGVLLNKHGEPIDLSEKPIKPKKKDYDSEEEYREALKEYREELKAYAEEIRESYTLINLRNKIVVFLEAPEFETFRMLYPILSHDTEKIEYRFTDKSAKGPLRTVKVVIEGWPATIFLTTDRKYMEELATRSFTATPEANKEKIEEVNKLTNLKVCFPWQFSEETEQTKCIKALIESLKRQLLDGKTDVVIPFSNLYELFPKEIVRDMRDFQHFCQFLKAITVLHFYQRPLMKIGERRFIVSITEDVRKALEVYSEVFETTRTGTEQRILSFYHEIVKTKPTWYLSEITYEYNKTHDKKLSSGRIGEMLKRLEQIGYVDIDKDAEDKRLNVYRPLVKDEEKSRISSILEIETFLPSKLKEGFEEWRKNISMETHLFIYKIFSEKEWGEAEISLEEASKIILEGPSRENFSLISKEENLEIFSKEDSKLKTEKKLETISISKTEISRDNSKFEVPKGLIPCEFCAKQGKPMFFATVEDLKGHIRAFHGGYPDKPDYVR
jgi:DNA-binding MarR family transcriptional regulator